VIKISEVNTFADFLKLEKRWGALLSEVEHNVFSTWEWLSTWWKYFGADKRLLILLAEENGELVGIAPLMYSIHTMFGVRQGKIEFIGHGLPVYSDFLIKREYTNCLDLFYKYLEGLQEKWCCLELRDIPENSSCLSQISTISKKVKPLNICLYISLPETYDEFLKNIKRKDRKELRRTARRLTDKGLKVELVDYSDIDSATKGLNNVIFLNQKRWRARGLPGAFGSRMIRDFHMEIVRTFSKKDWLGIYCLEISGKTVAALYGFKYKSKYYAYITGMDHEYSKFGIGNILFSSAIAKFIEDKLEEFDFIWGSDSYKFRWNPLSKWNYMAVHPKKRAFSNSKHFFYSTYWSYGARIKYFQNKVNKRLGNGE
jgi:CelD/BcsL family acetyltransferase involved in cellulose biosynthesis